MNNAHEIVEPHLTNNRRERTSADLVDEAERVVSLRGLSSLRARDLAEAAGCSVGYIYKLFPGGLDEIVLAVNARTLVRLDAHLAASTAPSAAGNDTEDAARERLVALALAYLDFAENHGLRWRALFDHQMPDGVPIPDAHLNRHDALFVHVDAPLATLAPQLGAEDRRLLARSLFSAVHGIVALGLDERFVAVPLAHLRRQLALVVRASGFGLGGAMAHPED